MEIEEQERAAFQSYKARVKISRNKIEEYLDERIVQRCHDTGDILEMNVVTEVWVPFFMKKVISLYKKINILSLFLHKCFYTDCII